MLYYSKGSKETIAALITILYTSKILIRLFKKLQDENLELNHKLDEFKKIQEEMIAQENLATLGSLSAGIAHEIKNPLGIILNSANIALKMKGSLEKVLTNANLANEKNNLTLKKLETSLDFIIEHEQRTNNIMHGMLLHSRSADKEFAETDLVLLLERTFDLAYHSMRIKCPLQINPFVKFDNVEMLNLIPLNIERAVFNILENAFFALNEKKENNPDFVPAMKIIGTNDHLNYTITIRDNGPGLPVELHEKYSLHFLQQSQQVRGQD